MDFYKIMLVGAGGFLGSMARYVTIRSVDQRFNTIFPYGTWVVNIAGSFILGLIYALASRKLGMTENWRIFLGAGFCGGFTTFSTFALENLNLLQGRSIGIAGSYIMASVLFGILAVFLGVWAGRSF